jgi:hypothetical protein
MFWSEVFGVDLSVFMTEQSSTFAPVPHSQMDKTRTTCDCKKRNVFKREAEAPRNLNSLRLAKFKKKIKVFTSRLINQHFSIPDGTVKGHTL